MDSWELFLYYAKLRQKDCYSMVLVQWEHCHPRFLWHDAPIAVKARAHVVALDFLRVASASSTRAEAPMWLAEMNAQCKCSVHMLLWTPVCVFKQSWTSGHSTVQSRVCKVTHLSKLCIQVTFDSSALWPKSCDQWMRRKCTMPMREHLDVN